MKQCRAESRTTDLSLLHGSAYERPLRLVLKANRRRGPSGVGKMAKREAAEAVGVAMKGTNRMEQKAP
jgi:hypothetical protein